jgi:hypothetical protein
MINRVKRWIVKTVREYDQVVPTIVQNGTPVIQIFKIANGYLVHRHPNGPNRYDETPTVVYCPTPLDVARQIVNGEALEKLGIRPDSSEQMHTTGYASAKLGVQNSI